MQNINVGSIIRELRTERGMPQKQLADKMNISDSLNLVPILKQFYHKGNI